MHTLGRKPYKCDQCGREFSLNHEYKNHIKDHIVVKGNLLCDDCGESFQTNYEMKRHRGKKLRKMPVSLLKQNNPCVDLVCDECGELFNRKSAYKYHLQSKHSEIKYACELCSFKTVTNLILQRHRASHSSPTLPCNECGKLFHTGPNLYRHKRNIHTDAKERKFQCKECGKGFSVKSTYDGHINMHKGIKPYKCDYCETPFQNASNKMNHVKRIHPEMLKTKPVNSDVGS